uniref:Uncharacterized protein n=1 Tax=Sander lucioperca TaxID=283035 RepID=A0A8C9WVF7_SANLU
MALTLQGPHLDIEDTCQLATHLVCSAFEREVSVKKLLGSGVSVNQPISTDGKTLLASAAHDGSANVAELLLTHGSDPLVRADVDGCDAEGRTALRAAAWGGHEEIVLTLLDYGAQVDKADSKGRTPLIAAAYMGHHEAVEILLDHNAEVNLADGDGRTALSVAALCVPTAAGVKESNLSSQILSGLSISNVKICCLSLFYVISN